MFMIELRRPTAAPLAEPTGGRKVRNAGTEIAAEALLQNTSRAKAAAQERDRVDMTFDGATLHGIVRDLFPLTRSITGDGLRETLARIDRFVPQRSPHRVPALDWEIPQEWNIRAAPRSETLDGRAVVDLADFNLHIVGYRSQSTGRSRAMNSRPMSTPFRGMEPTLIPF